MQAFRLRFPFFEEAEEVSLCFVNFFYAGILMTDQMDQQYFGVVNFSEGRVLLQQ